jgi:hypothetical protein
MFMMPMPPTKSEMEAIAARSCVSAAEDCSWSFRLSVMLLILKSSAWVGERRCWKRRMSVQHLSLAFQEPDHFHGQMIDPDRRADRIRILENALRRGHPQHDHFRFGLYVAIIDRTAFGQAPVAGGEIILGYSQHAGGPIVDRRRKMGDAGDGGGGRDDILGLAPDRCRVGLGQ